MALATPRRMWISSGVGCARLNSWFSRGISFLGAAGSRKPMSTSACSQCAQHAGHGLRHRPARRGGVASRTAKPPSAMPPFVGDHLDRRGEVERAEVRVGRDAAAPHGSGRRPRCACRSARSRTGRPRCCAAPPAQRPAGARAACSVGGPKSRGVMAVAHRWVTPSSASSSVSTMRALVQHVERAAGALDGFLAPQHVGPARRHQHQVVEAHDLHGAGGGADVAGVAGAGSG